MWLEPSVTRNIVLQRTWTSFLQIPQNVSTKLNRKYCWHQKRQAKTMQQIVQSGFSEEATKVWSYTYPRYKVMSKVELTRNLFGLLWKPELYYCFIVENKGVLKMTTDCSVSGKISSSTLWPYSVNNYTT